MKAVKSVTNKKVTRLEELFSSDLENPEFLKYDREIKPYYDILVQVINRREALGMTQERLAEKAGTYQSRISKIESGEFDFRLSTLIQIAEALGTELQVNLAPIEKRHSALASEWPLMVTLDVNSFVVNPANTMADDPAVNEDIVSALHRYAIPAISSPNRTSKYQDMNLVEQESV